MKNLTTIETLLNCNKLLNEYAFLLAQAKIDNNEALINELTKLTKELNKIKTEAAIDYYNEQAEHYTKLKEEKLNELTKYTK